MMANMSNVDLSVMNRCTKMCRWGTQCFRPGCTFAHSTKELRKQKCLYGNDCTNPMCDRDHAPITPKSQNTTTSSSTPRLQSVSSTPKSQSVASTPRSQSSTDSSVKSYASVLKRIETKPEMPVTKLQVKTSFDDMKMVENIANETLYNKVLSLVGEQFAGKVTGMLLELDGRELRVIEQVDALLEKKANECIELLQNSLYEKVLKLTNKRIAGKITGMLIETKEIMLTDEELMYRVDVAIQELRRSSEAVLNRIYEIASSSDTKELREIAELVSSLP